MNQFSVVGRLLIVVTAFGGCGLVLAQDPGAAPSTPPDAATQRPPEASPDPRESLDRPSAPSPAAASQPAGPASAPASQPTTEPAGPQDPRSSPRSLMAEFLSAVGDSEEKPERIQDAVRCLDLSEMARENPEIAQRRGPSLARHLDEVIEALINVYGKSRWEIPRQPTGNRVVFPAKGDVQIIMVRGEDGLWRFSAETIAALPKLREQIQQKREAKEKESPSTEAAADVPSELRSARATMRTFMEAMAKGDKTTAARCLDLSDRSAATLQETGEKLADQLLFVIDRLAVVVYQDIPPRPSAEPYTWHISDNGRIELARQESGENKGRWLFSKATVRSIEPLFKAYQDRPRVRASQGTTFWNNPRLWLLEHLPTRLKKEGFGLQTWQWIGLAVLLVLGYIVYRISLFAFCRIAQTVGRTGFADALPVGMASSLRPLATLVMVATCWGGLQLLLIPMQVLAYLWPALKFVMTAVAVWASYRMIDLGSGFVTVRATRTPSRLDEVLVPLARKTAKIIVVAVGLVFILQAVNVKPSTIEKLFAGIGIGGLAFALAAQESLKNFFGSITVVLDRPFQVGDWVKIGSVEGKIESVGLRSSRIRTFYDSQVTVPNADLTTATIDNLGRRRYRRTHCRLSVVYSTTPRQLEAFCEGVRELIRRHPHTRKDAYNVWVAEFAASSIDVLLDCFHETPDWNGELRARHRLLLDIIRLADRLGVQFAFPTQTVYLASEGDAGERAAPAPKTGGERGERPAAAPGEGGAKAPAEDALDWGRQAAATIVIEAQSQEQSPVPRTEPSQVD